MSASSYLRSRFSHLAAGALIIAAALGNSASAIPPGGPGGGGPCTAPPLPQSAFIPSFARGTIRETCGTLRPVANQPIEVILRVKQQPPICDPNNIPAPFFFEKSVAHGTTLADGSFNVQFFVSDAGLATDCSLLETKVRIKVYDDDGVTQVWQTAYYSAGADPQVYNVNEDVMVQCLTEGTRILVRSPNGDVSFNAEVFIDGVPFPQHTNGNGMLTIFPPVSAGAELVARAIVHESASQRSSHSQGATQNWKYRAYITSLPLKFDSNGDNVHFEPVIAANPNGAFTLNLNRDAAYIGIHLVGSIEWDASPMELSAFANKMQAASQFLYNATDGQMLLERVDLFDEGKVWDSSDFKVYANATHRANVDWPSEGFWEAEDRWFGRSSWMNMSRSNSSKTYIHEFGHYGMQLKDEYDDDDDSTRCTAAIDESNPIFARGGAKGACIMFQQQDLPKICSNHSDNPHRHGTKQGDEDCWSELKRHFTAEAPGPNGAPRWRLNTPVDRGVIVGKLPTIPVSGWNTDVEINDFNNTELCGPVNFQWRDNGGFADGARVFTQDASGRSILQGTTNANGKVVIFSLPPAETNITGLHIGDRVSAVWTRYINGQPQQFSKSRTFTDADCTNANVILITAPGQPPPEPQQQLVEAQALPFSLTAQIEPDVVVGQAIVRVRAGNTLAQAPTVRCSVDRETTARTVTMSFDAATGNWVGTLASVPGRFTVVAEVSALDTNGASAEYATSASIVAAANDIESELTNSDGSIELKVPAGAVAQPTQIAIGGSLAMLPDNFTGRVISGPTACVTAGPMLSAPATLRFTLPFESEDALLAQLDPTRLVVIAYDPATGKWNEIPSRFSKGALAVDAQIANLGTFALLETAPADQQPEPQPAPANPLPTIGGGGCGIGMVSLAPLTLALLVPARFRRRVAPRR